MNKVDKALENHKKGYNCAQAVACAFCDNIGLDEKTVFKLTEGFGAGMGSMQCTCGALSGAIMLAGLINSNGNIESPDSKAQTYQLSKEIVECFREKVGSTVCKEIKGIETKKLLCSCDGCIEIATQIAEEVLMNK